MLSRIHPANEALLNPVAGPDLSEDPLQSPDSAPPVEDSCADMFKGILMFTTCHIIKYFYFFS